MHDAENEAKQKPVEEMSFNEMVLELDGIVSDLESNRLELEQSLKKYERGVALLAASRSRLDDANQKVTALIGQIEPLDSAETDTSLS